MPELLRLTDDRVSYDRQEVAEAQAMRTFPDRHILKKCVEGPFMFTSVDLPAVPGYRYFIHSASVVGGNQPANDMTYAFWLGYQGGAIAYFIVCPFIPGVDDARGISMTLDILLDENKAVLLGAVGTGLFYGGTLSYAVVKDGEE